MSTPAGWYDDGSGRQRWWDGTGWSEDPASAQPAQKRTPTMGFIGLGLAVLGTILACIPTIFTIGAGWLVLLAAFVVSMIAVFRKNTRKWPSIVGIVLSIVGTIISLVVLTVVVIVALATGPVPTSDPAPAPTTSAPTAAEQRPAPDAIGAGFLSILQAGGVDDYDDEPNFAPCMGDNFYNSSLSDRAVASIASGVDLEEDDPEADEYESAIRAGMARCVL